MPFSHEKLKACQRAIEFVSWAHPLIESLPASASVRNQLDRASTSVPLNLAEGNGKFSMRDRARYFQIACGSALECAACLNVIVARKMKSDEEVATGKSLLLEIVNMTMALLDRIGSRLAEEPASYGLEEEED